jgi:transposase-like protein
MASNTQKNDRKPHLPSVERIQQELASAESIDDFFGREGIFARLFSKTLEEMLEAELTAHLGYEKHAAEGRNSGNSRNGKRDKKLRTQTGDVNIQVPRDRNGEYHSPLLEQHAASNTLEEKIINLYAKGISTRDIQDTMQDLYGIEVSAGTISAITDKVWALVEEWQNRPLETIYPIIYLDGLYVKLRQDGKVENCAVYVVLGIDLEGRKDILGQWVSQGSEGANFWLSVLTDLQTRGVEDIFIACVDGLKGFKEAIQSVFPQTAVQKCVVHQIRNSLKYIPWEDRKAFADDLKKIYKAPTREEAETQLLNLAETWGDQYTTAVRSWENNWEDLATMFDYPAEIRYLIYTTNAIEGYNRQLRKVTKNKAAFPSAKAVRKLLFLANRNITAKWTRPVPKWAKILNQLAIRFEGRFEI